MNRMKLSWTLAPLLALAVASASAGVLDPDCTAEKAAKSAATKAVVGVGGRCDPKEAASDTAKNVANIDDKKPLEDLRDDDKDKKKDDHKDKDKDKDKDDDRK